MTKTIAIFYLLVTLGTGHHAQTSARKLETPRVVRRIAFQSTDTPQTETKKPHEEDFCARMRAAYNILPARGGTIDARRWEGLSCGSPGFTATKPVRILLPAGTIKMTAGMTFKAPAIIQGIGTGNIHGMGNPEPEATTLKWDGTSGAALTIDARNPISGITLRDFAVIGNIHVRGATSGTGILLSGKNQISNFIIQNVSVKLFKNFGIQFMDYTFIGSVWNTVAYANGIDGFYIGRTVARGAPSQIRFFSSTALFNGRDGWRVDSGTQPMVEFYGCTGDNNRGIGLNGISTSIAVFGGNWESNAGSAMFLNGGSTVVNPLVSMNAGGGIDIAGSSVNIEGMAGGGNKNYDIRVAGGAKNIVLSGIPWGFTVSGDLSGTTFLGSPHPSTKEE